MGGEYYTKTTKKPCLWQTEHGNNNTWECFSCVLSHWSRGCQGQLCVKKCMHNAYQRPPTGFSHTCVDQYATGCSVMPHSRSAGTHLQHELAVVPADEDHLAWQPVAHAGAADQKP